MKLKTKLINLYGNSTIIVGLKIAFLMNGNIQQ